MCIRDRCMTAWLFIVPRRKLNRSKYSKWAIMCLTLLTKWTQQGKWSWPIVVCSFWNWQRTARGCGYGWVWPVMCIRTRYFIPVSYTHLDVYKRQMYTMMYSTDMVFLPYEYVIYLIFFSFGTMKMSHFIKYQSIKVLCFYIFFGIVFLPFWKLLGILWARQRLSADPLKQLNLENARRAMKTAGVFWAVWLRDAQS